MIIEFPTISRDQIPLYGGQKVSHTLSAPFGPIKTSRKLVSGIFVFGVGWGGVGCLVFPWCFVFLPISHTIPNSLGPS